MKMDDLDAKDLSNYARHGDERGFEALLERHLSLVFGTAWRQTGDHSLAEEISQNVFVILARKARRGFTVKRSLTAWLYQTTLNQTAHALRKERVRLSKMKTFEESSQIKETNPLQRAWMNDLLDEAMGRLGKLDREVLLLHYVEGRTFEEIGQVMGRTGTACQKRHTRAIGKLQNQLRRLGYASPAGLVALNLGSTLTDSYATMISSAQLSATVLTLAKGAGAIAGVGALWTKSLLAGGTILAIVTWIVAVQMIPEAQAQAWQRKWELPATSAAAVGVDGTVYFGGEDTFYAMDPSTKKVKWTYGKPEEPVRPVGGDPVSFPITRQSHLMERW